MRIVGLIAEYNPFHNGHKYHIEKAKEITDADMAIVVMSGNFVQRGAPAIMPKHLRAKSALLSGADLVLELPVRFATGTAETFAYGAVSLLHQLGCVDCICFGSECGDITKLKRFAKILADEPDEYKKLLQEYLKSGLSFPLARQKALGENEVLNKPNNILGIEYLKALYRLNSSMEPFTITRIESSYHDTTLSNRYSSASAIRESFKDTIEWKLLTDQIPPKSLDILRRDFGTRFPVVANDFSLLLKQRLLMESVATLAEYEDVSESLANKITKLRNQFVSYEQFCELLKTKDLTYTRISRALLHILLNIKKIDSNEGPTYARVLGFRKDSASVMTAMKDTTSIPLVTKLADAQISQEDIFTSDLYESVITEKFKTPFINEYEHQIIRV